MRTSPPIGEDFHPQVQIDWRANEPLDLASRHTPDITDPRAAMADENPLLALPLDVDHGPNVYRRPLLAELLHLACDTVRYLFLELLEGGLADELPDKEAERLGTDLVFWIEERALR